jgi:hypothetical protein
MYTEGEFLDFLIKAKKATYASQGDNASVTPLLEGSRQLEFQEGNFLYRDVYFGMSYFCRSRSCLLSRGSDLVHVLFRWS